MKSHLIAAGITIAIIGLVFRVPMARKLVTGMA